MSYSPYKTCIWPEVAVSEKLNIKQFWAQSIQFTTPVIEMGFCLGSSNVLCFWLCRQLILCRVTLGKSFLQFSAIKMAHAPPGHHSIIGRPSSGGLMFPEYVVYRGEQVNTIVYFFKHIPAIALLQSTSKLKF